MLIIWSPTTHFTRWTECWCKVVKTYHRAASCRHLLPSGHSGWDETWRHQVPADPDQYRTSLAALALKQTGEENKKQTTHETEKGRMFVLENVQFSLRASIFNPYFIKPTRIPHQHLAACAWQRSLITCIYTRKPVLCFSYSNTSSVCSVSIIINSVCSYSVTHRC